MRGLLQLNNSDMSEEVQLELLAPWYTQRPSESRTLDFFDAIPKYPFPTTTTIDRAERIQATFTLRGKTYLTEILPAQIKDAETGQEKLVIPGAREELVERALRFIAVQQIARTKLTHDVQNGRQAVTIFFSLSMLRRHLEQLGHGYKLSEIKEALDILADTRIAVEEQTIEAKTGKHRRTRDFASILTHYTASTVEGDTTGEEAYVAMTFHPAATAAILQLAFYPINQLRVGKLKRPLARWLTTRMSHNYRQAKRNGFVDQTGYHISLNTILDERGLPREARLRANVESVRAALMEMKERRILAEMMPYGEKLVHAPSKRRPKIVDAIWILYPSPEFVEEIVNGNKEMSIARTQAGGNKGESKLLPGFQDDASRGEIGALFPKEEQDGPLPRKGK
jgi:hypothetical protein